MLSRSILLLLATNTACSSDGPSFQWKIDAKRSLTQSVGDNSFNEPECVLIVSNFLIDSLPTAIGGFTKSIKNGDCS